jgi:hypothetical protein
MRRFLPLLLIITFTHLHPSLAQDARNLYRPVSVTLPLIHKVISSGMSAAAAIKSLDGVALKAESKVGDYLTLKGRVGDTSHEGPNYSLVLTFDRDQLARFSVFSSDETELEPWLEGNIAQLPHDSSTKHQVDSTAAVSDSSVMGDLSLTTTERWSSPDVTWSVERQDFIILTIKTFSAEFKLK